MLFSRLFLGADCVLSTIITLIIISIVNILRKGWVHGHYSFEKVVSTVVVEHDKASSTPQEGLIVFERCYEERIVISVACRGGTWGPKYNPRIED